MNKILDEETPLSIEPNQMDMFPIENITMNEESIERIIYDFCIFPYPVPKTMLWLANKYGVDNTFDLVLKLFAPILEGEEWEGNNYSVENLFILAFKASSIENLLEIWKVSNFHEIVSYLLSFNDSSNYFLEKYDLESRYKNYINSRDNSGTVEIADVEVA